MESLSEILENAFTKVGIDPTLAVIVRSERPDLSNYQCNGAFLAAKAMKQNPRALAEKVVAYLNEDAKPGVLLFEVAGPGYINITYGNVALESILSGDMRCPVNIPKHHGRIVLDFGGPNVAKPMHVGHLRSLVIGDALQRLLRFVGYEVISDIHLGDWGLQMGLLLAALQDVSTSEITIDLLEETYPQASARAKTDEAFKALAQGYTQQLQQGDQELLDKWKKFLSVSMATVERELLALNVNFTTYRGESDAQGSIDSMIQDFIDQGLAIESDGALVVNIGDPPLILRKSDGAALYSTTDLATILDRKVQYEPDRIIYVTDGRQQLHFQQVFKAAKAVGYANDIEFDHVWFGTVNGPDGKPLKTRAGGVPKLHDLIQEATTKAAEKNPEVAELVAMAALKFADLQNPRTSSYVFDLDRFLSFEGKTGPYLIYQAVRIKSILANRSVSPGPIQIITPLETSLAFKLLMQYPAAIQDAVRHLSPKEIADHAYDLAQTFSKFYAGHTIADNGSRLSLAIMVLRQLEECLGILGINIPDKM